MQWGILEPKKEKKKKRERNSKRRNPLNSSINNSIIAVVFLFVCFNKLERFIYEKKPLLIYLCKCNKAKK